MNSTKRDHQLLIDGLRLKTILDKQFAILGYSGLDALYYEMERHGFVFESERTYSIEQLKTFFEMIFGEEAAMIAVDRIRKAASQ